MRPPTGVRRSCSTRYLLFGRPTSDAPLVALVALVELKTHIRL
jgi:hypothetical protein